MFKNIEYPEFRQKLIDLVREAVTQEPELRERAERLGRLLGRKTDYGEIEVHIVSFSRRVSVEDLKEQLRNLARAANYATSPPNGCTREQFQSYMYSGDLEKAIWEALGQEGPYRH